MNIIKYSQTIISKYFDLFGDFPGSCLLQKIITILEKTHEFPNKQQIQKIYDLERFQLPTNWNNIKKNVNMNISCALCQIHFKAGDIVSRIQCRCRYVFHCNKTCSIKKYLEQTDNCPNCNKYIKLT